MALIVGILLYWFIEGFSNFILHINAYVFSKTDELTEILFWLILTLAILLGELVFFLVGRITDSLKLKLSLGLVVLSRILSQFYIAEALMFLFVAIFFISLLFLFLEIFKWYGSVDYFNNYEVLVLGFIIGVGIQFALIIALYSSNLTTELLKIPITFACAGILIYLFIVRFNDLTAQKARPTVEKKELLSKLPELNYFHFIVLAAFAFIAINWIFNPMILSAYDSINLNRSGAINNGISIVSYYSFTFYALLGVISLCVSFYLVRKVLSLENPKQIKYILLILNLVFFVLNIVALFSLGANRPNFAPILLSAINIIGTITIILNLSFLFKSYSLPRGITLYRRFIAFVFTLVVCIVSVIYVTWSLRFSFILTIVVVSAVSSGLFCYQFTNKASLTLTNNKATLRLKLNAYPILLILLVVNGIAFAAAAQPLRVEEGSDDPLFMTWNTHNAIGVDDKFDIDRIVEEIKEQEPDVVGLNEIDLGASKTGFVDLASYIAQKLQMYYYFGPSFCNHYGNAIFSKYPIESAKNMDLPRVKSNMEPRSVIQIKIKINSKTWTTYQTHLALSPEDRKEQVDFILDLIKNDDDERVVWMGDFNFRPDSDEYKLLNKTSGVTLLDTHRILNAEPDLTCCFDENNEPTARIDYILCSPGLSPQKTKVVCSLASDHCAELTQF